MKLFYVSITIAAIVLASVFSMGWKILDITETIKKDVVTIDKATAVHSERMTNLERHLKWNSGHDRKP